MGDCVTEYTEAEKGLLQSQLRHARAVTPAMIEAGAEVIWAAFDGLVPYGLVGREVAEKVFLAMTAARKI